MSDRPANCQNIAYRQNAPGLENARTADETALTPLTLADATRRMTKWEMYDELFKTLQEDAELLYSQFELHEHTINAMLWPADSYAKTQMYKLNHFLMLYHEGRCRELVDMLKVLLALLCKVFQEQSNELMAIDADSLD